MVSEVGYGLINDFFKLFFSGQNLFKMSCDCDEIFLNSFLIVASKASDLISKTVNFHYHTHGPHTFDNKKWVNFVSRQ